MQNYIDYYIQSWPFLCQKNKTKMETKKKGGGRHGAHGVARWGLYIVSLCCCASLCLPPSHTLIFLDKKYILLLQYYYYALLNIG